jgi:hypothetical protein
MAEVRKAITAALGGLVAILGTGIVPEPWNTWAVTVVMVATVLGVYNVPNEPAAEEPEAKPYSGIG